jgi:hypothetical protein
MKTTPTAAKPGPLVHKPLFGGAKPSAPKKPPCPR